MRDPDRQRKCEKEGECKTNRERKRDRKWDIHTYREMERGRESWRKGGRDPYLDVDTPPGREDLWSTKFHNFVLRF